MSQPTQRATNYTARSNIELAQIFLHANGQSAPRSGGARDVGRGAGRHTPNTASESWRTPNTDFFSLSLSVGENRDRAAGVPQPQGPARLGMHRTATGALPLPRTPVPRVRDAQVK